jgi:hypothetical protein
MVGSDGQPGLEGIKVHGDWTIEVTNPDGSLARNIQFKNSIKEDGFGALATLMTQDIFISDRWIYFGIGSTETGGWNHDGMKCAESESTFLFTKTNAVAVRTADLKGSIWGAGCTVSIENDSKIGWIRKIDGRFATSGDFALTGFSNSDNIFSAKTLSPSIQVVDGQYISATVIYSFN